MGLVARNDRASEGHKQFTWLDATKIGQAEGMTLRGRETVKYGHESPRDSEPRMTMLVSASKEITQITVIIFFI